MSDRLIPHQNQDGIKPTQVFEAEDCEMLRALYDFKATIDQTLEFSKNDHFVLHSSSNKQRNWWHVVNCEGKIGYIPSNYVETVNVNPKYIVTFLSKCIQVLQKELPSTDSGGGKRQQLLKELSDRKRKIEGGMRSPIPPRPPTRGPSSSPSISPCDLASATPTKTLRKSATAQSISSAIKHPVRQSMSDTSNCCGDRITVNHAETEKIVNNIPDSPVVKEIKPQYNSVKNSIDSELTESDLYKLIQEVRQHTELAFELSRVAVGVVVSNLSELLSPTSSKPINSLLRMLDGDLNPPDQVLDETHDAYRLRFVLDELMSCKGDSQQRSWELYEDEANIIGLLKELISILKNADPAISRRVLSREKFKAASELQEYYQMEIRWSIRQLLLDAFISMCGLHTAVITLFLNSVLPMELARDMISNPRNITRLVNTSNLLTVIFSMGEPMPITHLEHIGLDFMGFIIGLIEDPPDTDVQEQIPDSFFRLVLSYNLQFTPLSATNIVVESLAKRNSAKMFTEKILFILNREEDPARVYEHHKRKHPNSTMKLIIDVFSSPRAASHFYTNDINVLIDIIVRQLTDLSPGDEKRSKYLELCRLVLRNTNYSESQHRCSDLHKCFTRIFCEETQASNKDQLLVRDISNEFPQYFKA